MIIHFPYWDFKLKKKKTKKEAIPPPPPFFSRMFEKLKWEGDDM